MVRAALSYHPYAISEFYPHFQIEKKLKKVIAI
jgi:hypothetical protein